MSKKKLFQYVVLVALKSRVLRGVYDEAGHQVKHRTLCFSWDTVTDDDKLYLVNCGRCVLSKAPEPEARAPLLTIITTAPLELVCLDFVQQRMLTS